MAYNGYPDSQQRAYALPNTQRQSPRGYQQAQTGPSNPPSQSQGARPQHDNYYRPEHSYEEQPQGYDYKYQEPYDQHGATNHPVRHGHNHSEPSYNHAGGWTNTPTAQYDSGPPRDDMRGHNYRERGGGYRGRRGHIRGGFDAGGEGRDRGDHLGPGYSHASSRAEESRGRGTRLAAHQPPQRPTDHYSQHNPANRTMPPNQAYPRDAGGEFARDRHQMVDQMARLDMRSQRHPPQHDRGGRRGVGEDSQPPRRVGHAGQHPHSPGAQGYFNSRPGPQSRHPREAQSAHGHGYDSQDTAPTAGFDPPGRSMTMSALEHPGDFPQPQRTNTMPYPVHGRAGVPDRPSTATGVRPAPQRMYSRDTRDHSQGHYSEGYGTNEEYPQHTPMSPHGGYGEQYDDPRQGDPNYYAQSQNNSVPQPPYQHSQHQQPAHHSNEQTQGTFYEQAQPGAHQTAQLSHAKSQPNLREPQTAIFEMAGDIPEVPPVPRVKPYEPDTEQQRFGPSEIYEPMHRGSNSEISNFGDPRSEGAMQGGAHLSPSGVAPNHPHQGQGPNNYPSHRMPVRPGLMANSLVNLNDRPPPVRSYDIPAQNMYTPQPQPQPQPQAQLQQQQQQPYIQSPPPQQRLQHHAPASTGPSKVDKQIEAPVTPQELEQLRMAIKNNPGDQKSALRLATRLVEASNVLVPNASDPRTRGKARERYLTDAHKVLKKLSNSQNAEAMFFFADCQGRGLFGNEPDMKEAFTLYHSAAKLNHAAAAYRTAVCCEIGHEDGGGTRKDPLKAMQWYKRAATLGDPPAMYKMGMIMLKGLLGQQRNPREAVGWLKRAAERADTENPHALHELGLLYESAQPNDAIIRDEAYALSLFEDAADLGYKFSQFRLGCAYEFGQMGCPIDSRQSIRWYSQAAQQEEHQAELALSGWYLTGSDNVLSQSDTEAYLWARKAAMAGLAKAEYALGYFTEVGIGVPANLEDAKRWYWRAAAQDFPKARERLEDLKRAGRNGPRQRERISRSRIEKQDGDCSVM